MTLKVFAVLGSACLLAACSSNDDDNDAPDTGQADAAATATGRRYADRISAAAHRLVLRFPI